MSTPTNQNDELTQAKLTGTNVGSEYLIDPDTGQPYDSSHPLPISGSFSSTPPVSVVSTANSTTTPLTANSVFTGTSESALAYGSISVEVFADQASAANGLSIQQSQDNTNWDTKNAYTISASTAFQVTLNLVGQYFRVVYTNGGTNQGTFRLQTIKLVSTASAGSSNQRVNAQSGDFVAGSIVDLATLAGIVSSNKAAVKAGANDLATNSIVDLATLLTLAGTPTDANTVNSIQGRLTKIRDLLNSTLGVQQTDLSTGPTTISAAQPVIGTPVSNATVSLTLGQGQSSWLAQVSANAGFTSATTVVVDQSIDGGTTWFSVNFKVAGSLSTTPVQSVVGPGPLLLSGDAASKGILRVRCSVLNGGESLSVKIVSSAGIGSVGLLSSVPAGSNLMGGMYVYDSAGTNKLAVDGSGNASVKVTNGNANGQATMANSSPVVIASNQSAVPQNITQYNSSAVGISNPQFVDGAAQQGPVNITNAGGASGGTSPTFTGTCTASADNSITFASRVRTVQLHNQSANNVPYEHDIAATANSPYLAPGQMIIVDIHTTTVHVYPSNALPINAASGLQVRGWA